MKVEDVNRVPVVVMGYLWSMRGGGAPFSGSHPRVVVRLLVVHAPLVTNSKRLMFFDETCRHRLQSYRALWWFRWLMNVVSGPVVVTVAFGAGEISSRTGPSGGSGGSSKV